MTQELKHTRIRTSFLEDEEDVQKIYVHSIRELDLIKVFGIKKIARLVQTKYLHMMRRPNTELLHSRRFTAKSYSTFGIRSLSCNDKTRMSMNILKPIFPI